MQAIVITEEFWANSQLSIARYFGQVNVDGHTYIIVNKEGKDIYELSEEAEKEGRRKVIAPGEPADLCRVDFIRYYRKLGREEMLKFLEANPNVGELSGEKATVKKMVELWISRKENAETASIGK